MYLQKLGTFGALEQNPKFANLNETEQEICSVHLVVESQPGLSGRPGVETICRAAASWVEAWDFSQ